MNNEQDNRSNQSNAWRDSLPHRHRVTGLLLGSLNQFQSPSLCVWGAGECNDIDVGALLNKLSQLELVDIDQSLIETATVKQGVANDPRLKIRQVDLSGIANDLAQLKQGQASADSLKSLHEEIANAKLPLAQYNVVASTCLLSQIIQHAVQCLGQDDVSQLAPAIAAIRRRHLHMMLQHTLPGGHSILITDVTSSEALPELATLTDSPTDQAKLVELFQTKIMDGNHFHGLNPVTIDETIRVDQQIQQQIDNFEVSMPWIWNGTSRHYACMGFLMIKK